MDECTHILHMGVIVAGLWTLDFTLCRTLVPSVIQGRDRNLARWFLLHSCVNFVIAALCLPAFMYTSKDPTMVFDASRTHPYAAWRWPLKIAGSIHMYHCIGAFSLTSQDWFHHILFLPTLCFPGIIFDWGCLGNVLVFFVCGLPGGIDYLILGLQRTGRIPRLNQKRICANLNLWLRMPGILFAMGICFAARSRHPPHVPMWAFSLQITFMPFNVLFYTKQSLISYALHTVKKKHMMPVNMTWDDLKQIQDTPLG